MINDNYVLTTLDKNPEYYNDVIILIENEFKYEHNHKFEIDFAPLVNPNNFQNCLMIINKQSNELVAHLGYLKKIFCKNNIELPVVFIGGIATHNKYRGKKLFTYLMNECFKKNNQTALYLLWSEINDLYEKFDFVRTGAILETGKNVITSDNIPEGYIKTSYSNLTHAEFTNVTELYTEQIENKLFSIKRSPLDWDIIREMSSVTLFIKKNHQKEIIAYFCYGKGNDLKQIIHEFAANDWEAEKKNIESFKLWLTENYLEHYPNHQLQYNAFFKLGNIKTLNQFLSQFKIQIIKIESNNVLINYKDEKHNLTYKDFLNGLFGPYPLEEFKSFNLYPYISGLDSI